MNPVPPSAVPPERADLRFTLVSQAPFGFDWSGAEIVDEQGRQADGSPDFIFARLAGREALRVPGALDAYLSDEEIVCHLVDDRHAYLVEIVLLGLVMALWLERRGTPVLHASVVSVGGSAAGFLAGSGVGKTTTLTACLRRGHALVCDDLLALREQDSGVRAERGYPALRLWPEQAARFVGAVEDLPVLHPDFDKRRVLVGPGGFGRFAEGDVPLRRLYLPERHDDPDTGVRLERLPLDQALMALLRHSFLPREVQRFGWQPRRLRRLARVAAEVPVVRIRYPSGLDLLPDVLARVEQDLLQDDTPVS